MKVRELAGFGAILCSGTALVLGACAHSPPQRQRTATPATVVILGNKVAPAPKCTCDAQARRARAWKAYAEKLETQLGIPPASASSSP